MEDHTHASVGLDGLLGLTIVDLTTESCVVEIDIDERHTQPYGIVHGGTYCTLVEAAASNAAAFYAMSMGLPGCVGVSNTTDFYRSQREGRIRAVASPIHRGRTQQVWQVEVTRTEDGKLVARGQVRLQNVLDPNAIGGLGSFGPGEEGEAEPR